MSNLDYFIKFFKWGVKSVLDTCLFFWYKNCMSRLLRIEYKDAWYHAMNRGWNREVIFHEEM